MPYLHSLAVGRAGAHLGSGAAAEVERRNRHGLHRAAYASLGRWQAWPWTGIGGERRGFGTY